MRVAALYDIHGNLPALEAVLADVRAAGVDAILVGGDVVPGPMPLECLALLKSLDRPVRYISGNGEREVLAARAGDVSAKIPERYRESMLWNAGQLSDVDAGVIAEWASTLTLDIDGVGRVFFCHATPRSDTTIFTKLTGESLLVPEFAGVDAELIVCGHTHMQFDRVVDGVRVVNAGSVGMPFGEPGAYWLELGGGVALRRTHYDLDAAAARVRASSYPLADEFAAQNILAPPTEDTMLTAFTRASLG